MCGGKPKPKPKPKPRPRCPPRKPCKQTPLYGQETNTSCLIASVRMVLATQTGKNIPEKNLREQSQKYPGSWNPANGGTRMDNATSLLRANGLSKASNPKKGTVSDIQKATANGDPVIIAYNNPGGGGHAVVVDRVTTNRDGTRTLTIRDPWPPPPGKGERKQMSESEFLKRGFNGTIITTN